MTGRIVVAMSGGVDSSVAAGLLAEAGADVVGISLKLWEHPEGESGHGCCTPDDLRDARRVAEALEIPHYVFDLVEEFEERVVEGFVDEYLSGRTPNPCVACNDTVKFDTLLRRARALGAEALATGHYARIEGAPPQLLRGVDASKDQSYFLYNVSPDVLGYLRFPVGGLAKDEVRRHAHRLGLPVATSRTARRSASCQAETTPRSSQTGWRRSACTPACSRGRPGRCSAATMACTASPSGSAAGSRSPPRGAARASAST